MDNIRIETNRLILRRFEESDLEAVYLLFSDKEVNAFLPWYPVKDMDEAAHFLEQRLKGQEVLFRSLSERGSLSYRLCAYGGGRQP